jgi:hypothetical protein
MHEARGPDGKAARDPAQAEAPAAAESSYLKLPWPLVAGGLAAVLLLALAAGLLANRYLRQPIVVLPPATEVPLAAPTPSVASAGTTDALGTRSVATQSSLAAATATVGPAATVGMAATAQATAQVVAVATQTAVPAATAEPVATAVPVGTAMPTGRPTVSPALVDEIDQAYERYWQVRAEALFDLDESRLPEVMAGEHLAAAGRLIRQLRAENRAIETTVKHSYVLVDVTLDSVQIADTYVDNSVYIDPESRARLSEPPGNTLKELYQMNRIDGDWRVVSLARSS